MQRLVKLRDDLAGMAAVEFALVTPFIVALILGGVELTQGINIDRKVVVAARTVADLTAQYPQDNISASYMTSLIMNAGKTVIAPYDQSKVKIVVSGIRVDDKGVAKIEWSAATPNATARSTGTAPINNNLKVANTALIWAEVTYSYTPMFGSAISGTLDLKEALFMRPRTQTCIKYDSKGCA